MKQKINTRCIGCGHRRPIADCYKESYHICYYILDTGKQRGCSVEKMSALYHRGMSYKGGLMERLTERSRKTGTAIPSKKLGDLCMSISFCDDYDVCYGCPVKTLLTRLCEYEDTGLTPTQINKIRKIRQHGKCQRIIMGVPKTKKIKQKVSRYGLYIKGKKYYLCDLSTYHFGEIVDVIVNEQSNHAKVFIGDTIIEEFDL